MAPLEIHQRLVEVLFKGIALAAAEPDKYQDQLLGQ
jgi:hypothetical protein